MCSKFSELDQLAAQAREGNEMAWMTVYTTLWPIVVSFVGRKIYLPRDLSEDVAQETFILILNKLDSWDPDRGRFVSWFFGVADHQCVDYWRKHHPGRDAYLEDELLDPPVLGSDVPYTTIDNRILLADPIQKLSSDQREILFLKAVCGFKSHEIAEMMSSKPEASRQRLTAEAVRQRLTQIRKTLRKEIEQRRGE